MKYNVRFNYHTSVEITVEASDAAEALEKAEIEVEDSKYNEDLIQNLQPDGDTEVINDETGCEEHP